MNYSMLFKSNDEGKVDVAGRFCFLLSFLETYGDEGDTERMSFTFHYHSYVEEKVFLREDYRKKLSTCDCFIFVADPRRVCDGLFIHAIEDGLRFVCRANCVASSQLFGGRCEQLRGYEARMALLWGSDEATMY